MKSEIPKKYQEIKESAKQLLLKGKFVNSIEKYIEAYEILTNNVKLLENIENFKVQENRAIVKTNIGICYMKVGDYVKAVANFNSAYEICPTYEKSLYRLALSYKAIGDYQQAALVLQKMRTSVGDSGVQNLLKEVM